MGFEFRPHRSTIDMIFTLRQLQEKSFELCRPLIVVFIDLTTKAFDMVCRGGLFAILQRLGCPDTLLSIISGFHNHMQASVRYNGSTSKAFPVTRGVKQGCVLAPTLFAVAILRGDLGGPWPPRFLLGPPSFFLHFPFKFVWLTYAVLPNAFCKIPDILSTAPDLSCVVIRRQHRENRDNQYC